nr:hypothetical protein [Pyrinomonadaceae bacterium]
MRYFKTFRGKLLIILAVLLVATLGFQYYLNLRTQEENNTNRKMRERALVAGITLGFNSFTSSEYILDLVKRPNQSFFDEKTSKLVKGIIIINNKWQITDSLDPEYLPTTDENNQIKYLNLKDLQKLPPLMEGNKLGDDLKNFPNANMDNSADFADGEAHVIPIQTTSEGRWYMMVILENDRKEAASRAARPLIYTLGILLVSTLVTFF